MISIFKSTDGPAISRCTFECADAILEIVREPKSDYVHARIDCEGVSDTLMLLPGGKATTSDVLVMELARGGKHPLYRKALEAIKTPHRLDEGKCSRACVFRQRSDFPIARVTYFFAAETASERDDPKARFAAIAAE